MLIQAENGMVREVSEKFIRELNPLELVRVDYKDIKFDRECPKCGKKELRRYVDEFRSSGAPPVMPMYICMGCKAQSYYLTDAYLEYLVENNKGLFTEQELKELSSDKKAFMEELKGYIIRILSSKKITSIK